MELTEKIRSAYFWTFLGNLARQGLSFWISMMLARFLSPGDYGLAAVVAIFVTMLSAMQDAGMGQAIVYFGEAELPTFYTVSAFSGSLFGALLFLMAAPISFFYHAPVLVPVVHWMSLSLVLGGFRSVSQSLVTKRLLFRKIAVIESISSLVAGAVAVWAAAHGYGVWSIVLNCLLSAGAATALMLAAVPPRFTLRPNLAAAKRLVRWSLPLTGSSLLWSFYDNSDDLVVGRLANAQQLGLYTLAFRLATLINERVNAVVGRVSYPAFAALREEPGQVVRHWFSVTRTSALFSVPALTMLGMCATDFVAVVLGPKWLAAVPVVRILCAVAAIRILTPVVINLLPALGKTGLAFRYTLLNAVVMPISFVVGCEWGGIRGVAFAWLAVFPFLAARLLATALALTGASWKAYVQNLRIPAGCALTVAGAMLPGLFLLQPGVLRLVISGLAGGAAFAGWLYALFVRPRFGAVRQPLTQAVPEACSVQN